MLYIVCIIIIIVFLLALFLFLKVSKLKDINKSLEICSSKINDVLEEKLNLVNKLLKNIKEEKIKKEFVYSDDYNIYEKENALFNVSFNINKYVKDNNIKKLKKQVHELNILEENLDGLKDFYNSNVLNYNELFLKRFLNKFYRLMKFKDYKSFKIRKLEEYEIFRN